MKKILSTEQLYELQCIIQKNGFLTKMEVKYFSKKYSINHKLFLKLLRVEKIAYKSRNLENILEAHSIEITDNKIKLENLIKLGDWKFDIFKNSKNIFCSFNCEICKKNSLSQLRKFINRKYFLLKPICNDCINTKITNTPEWLKENSIAQKECKNRPEIKENYSKKIKSKWAEPGYKENMSLKMKEKWTSDEYRKNIKKGNILIYGFENATQNVDVFNKIQHNGFKLKEYIMPSGNIIKIQGYENLGLDLLLKTYKEEDLIIGNKNIENKIGKIFYFDINNKKHRYYPDIYIDSINKIIEVKSIWTYNKEIEKNLLKQQICLNQSFKFEFFIFDKKERMFL